MKKNIPKEQRVYSYRYIDQLYVYDNSDSALITYPIVENGRLVSSDIDLPDSILRKMERAGIENPFYNPLVYSPGGTNEKNKKILRLPKKINKGSFIKSFMYCIAA